MLRKGHHEMWTEGLLCDLVLRAHPAMEDGDGAGEPVEVKMHALVASSMAPTIKKMLSGQFKESHCGAPIDLPTEHVDAASLRSVVSVSCMPLST